MKTLIVGGTTEGIGAYVARRIPMAADHAVNIPSPKELDVTVEESIAEYLFQHGPFDEIVYCAGVPMLKYAQKMTMDDYHWVFNVNAFGFPRLLGEHLDQYDFHAVNAVAVVSDAAHTPMRGSLAYCSSKAALAMAIRVLARETASLGWRVNGVSPGVVAGTPMTTWIEDNVPGFRGWTSEQARDYALGSIPLGRFARLDEVSAVILATLAGPQAQTGTIVEIAGGK